MRSFVILVFFYAWLSSAWAVLFYSTADPTFNSAPPQGALAGSGWQFQGDWADFSGTVISGNLFITAQHVGGQVGQFFSFNGVNYPTVAFFDDPQSDLRICQVSGELPAAAPLYSGASEVGASIVVIGRGTQRGSPVQVSGLIGSALKGWQWGTFDGVRRWGENPVSAIATNESPSSTGTGQSSDVLQMNFDAGAGPTEADLSYGDSGGAVFINDGGVWKLAGINYAVTGPYNTEPTDPGFNAAIFDQGGLYEKSASGAWVYIPPLPQNQPGSFFATRISTRVSWINSIIASASAPSVKSAPEAQGPYSPDASAQINASAKQIFIPAPSGTRFYVVEGGVVVQSVKLQSNGLVIQYQ